MMKNKFNYIIILMIFAVTCYAFLTGCRKSSTTVIYPITPQYTSEFGDVIVMPQPQVVKINKEGKVLRTTSQSGKLVIEAPEANTFNSDVVLTISETASKGNESSLLTVGSIIYRITATRDGVPVNYLNHPLNITLSNEDKFSSAENFYIGVKEIESGDWQLINVYSSNPSARTSIGSKNQFSYSIYKTNILLALFADVKNSLANTPKVFDIVATLSPAIIEAKDSAYTDDLKVTLNLSGENLSGLTSDNYNVKVTYLTSNTNDTPLKVDNKNVAYLSGSGKNKYEAFGEGYAHYFQFVPLSSNYTSGFAPSITFDINLKNVKESDFPTDFIVELSNSDSKALPFAYSSILSFSKESDSSSDTKSDTDTNTDTETNTDTNSDTNTDTETNTNTGTDTTIDPEPQEPKAVISLKSPTADFPVTASNIELEFSKDVSWAQTDLSRITIDNNAEIQSCSYNNKILTLTLKDSLKYGQSYIITVSNLDYAENSSFAFTTEPKATLSLKSAATDFQVANNSIELEFSKDISWNPADNSKITIDNNAQISSCSYSNKVLTLSLNKRLKFNSTYLIGITGIDAVENNTLSLKTEANGTVALRSAAENFPVSGTIELEFSKDTPVSNEDLAFISLDNNAVIADHSYLNKVLQLNVQGQLKYDTIYTVLFNGFDGVADNTFLKFKTEKISATPVIALSDDSIVPALNNRSILQPRILINFGKAVSNSSLSLENIKLNGAALPNSCTLNFETDKQNATLVFTENLDVFSDYELTIDSFIDDDNGVIEASELAFKTVPPTEILGEGTIDSPFLIYTENHLRKLNETTPVNYLSGNYFYKQMDDIALADEWTPIGDYTSGAFFNGKYDGNNKTISDIVISNGGDYIGLFSVIYGGAVYNLTIKDVDITGMNFIATLCSFLVDSVVENVKMEGDINISSSTGGFYIGGLAAVTSATLNKTILRKVQITGNLNIAKNDPNTSSYIGGLIGGVIMNVNTEISDCCVDSPNGIIRGGFGGLVGSGQLLKISNSYVRTKFEGNGAGLIGEASNVIIENCYADCQFYPHPAASGISTAGGLISAADSSCSISNCYASGTIYLETLGRNIGTLIGVNQSATVNNSFSTVKITVGDSYAYDGNATSYNSAVAGSPLWYSEIGSSYVYNSDGTNYFGTGYNTSLNWSSAHWFNLTEGGFPKLIGLPNR